MTQQRLWHETPEQALQSLVDALGGFKRVGSRMWPTLPAEEAGRRLSDCLNPARAHKLSISELCWLLKQGRAADCHVAMTFINEDSGYGPPTPIEPEDEFDKSVRLFERSVEHLSGLAQKLDTQRQLIAQIRSNVPRIPRRVA